MLPLLVPIFKKDKKDDPGNYRAVNLSFLPGKITVKIILEGTEKYLKDNAILSHSQHSFMKFLLIKPDFPL